MAEVAPLLTRQGWELVTPMAASGAATGGAVGGATGMALVAGGGLILVVAYVVARRTRSAAGAAKTAAAKKPAGGATGAGGRVAGLLARAKGLTAGGRPGGGAAGGGSRTGRGRLGLPGRGKSGTGSGTNRSGTGAKTAAGGARKGGGRLAGLRAKLPGRKTGSAAGGTKGSPTGRSTGAGGGGSKPAGAATASGGRPGLARRIVGAVRPSRIRKALGGRGGGVQRPPPTAKGSGRPTGRSTNDRSTTNPTGTPGRVARVRGALGSLIGRVRPGTTSRPVGKRERLTGTPPGSRGTHPVVRDAIDTATGTTTRTRRPLGGNVMTTAKGRRPSIPTGGSAGGSSSGGGGFSASRTPHAAVIEAMSQSAHTYDPSNALRVIELYTGALESIDAHANMLRIQGAKTTEEFYLHPAAGQLLSALGDQLAKYRNVVEDARSAFETVHKDDLERIRNPQRGQDRWDIGANVD